MGQVSRRYRVGIPLVSHWYRIDSSGAGNMAIGELQKYQIYTYELPQRHKDTKRQRLAISN